MLSFTILIFNSIPTFIFHNRITSQVVFQEIYMLLGDGHCL